MFRGSGPALLAAAALTAGVLTGPGAAFAADTRTSLTATQMSAALRAVGTTTSAAARPGWRGTESISASGLSLTSRYVADPAHGIAMDQIISGVVNQTEYAVSGVGAYEYAGDRASRKAMAMIGHPSARWVLTRSKLKLSTWMRDNLSPPSEVLAGDSPAGTRTTHDDGSADYTFTDDGTTATLHVDPTGALTSVRATGSGISERMTYAYGPQHLKAPGASATVSRNTMDRALAYLDMATIVGGVADGGAADARTRAHGRAVSVSSVRKAVRSEATGINKLLKVTMVRVTDIAGGARVSATNPWTHRTVTYTVKASGRKVIVAG
jgi:hypothetical protein